MKIIITESQVSLLKENSIVDMDLQQLYDRAIKLKKVVSKNIQRELNYPIIDIDNFSKYNLKNLLDLKNKKQIELYKKNRLFFEYNKTYLQQVVDYLKEEE